MSPRASPSGGYDRPDLWRLEDIRQAGNDPNAEAILENIWANMTDADKKAFFRYLQAEPDMLEMQKQRTRQAKFPTKRKRRK